MFTSFLKLVFDEKFKNRITELELAILFHLILFIHLKGCKTATLVFRLETDYFSMVVIRKSAKIRREIGCESVNAALVQVSWFGQFRNCVCIYTRIEGIKSITIEIIKRSGTNPARNLKPEI